MRNETQDQNQIQGNESKILSNRVPDQAGHSYKTGIKEAFLCHSDINRLIKAFYLPEDVEAHKMYLFDLIYEYYEKKKKVQGLLKTACSAQFRRAFLIGCLINFANQFTGINVIVFYAKQLYISVGFSNADFLVFIGSKLNQWSP